MLQTSESDIPAFHVSREAGSATKVVLTGRWTLLGLARRLETLTQALKPYARDPDVHWDLTHVEALDSVGAFILWQINDRRQPAHLNLQPEHLALIRRWAERQIPQIQTVPHRRFDLVSALAWVGRAGAGNLLSFVTLLGQVVLDMGFLIRHPARIPWREISATIYESGARALGVTAVVGFLIGVVISYLGAQTLQGYGAQTFIINILGIGVIRELGPLLTAILVGGRSGSAMAAEIGVMRVTQELDALSAMGTSQTLRLVLPKVVGLAIAVPLLVVWTDAIGLLGGMLAARASLGIGLARLFQALPEVVPLANFWFGIIKGAVFGCVIALIACDHGLRIKPNTESLGKETTNSVVTTITVVILVDAILAVVFQSVGLQ